jgi:nucleotide-binding universal stress UspA family protein
MFAGRCVHVLSVADADVAWWTGLPVDGSPAWDSVYADATRASKQEHQELARLIAAEMEQAGHAVEVQCPAGDPATALLEAARAWSADLIVMGTRGRTGVARLILGSVARNVLHHARCSVLVTRAPEHP